MSDQLAIDGGKPVRTAPWPKKGKRFGAEELQQLKEALDQNTLFYLYGKKTGEMCRKMRRLTGAKFALGCSSCTAAIHGALKGCGVGPGDEVITTPVTDAGTLAGILYEGAVPVFADIDPATYNLTAATVATRISRRTRAVIAVHLAGGPVDIVPLAKLCRRKKIKLIEDCAQSWGTRIAGRPVGSFGDFGCFSLNDYKHISSGDGGVIVTSDEQLYHQAWLAIDKCYDRVKRNRPMHFVAPNYRISELQSAVAIAQLDRLPGIVRTRHVLGERLTRNLRGIPGVRPHAVVRGGYHTYWFYLIGIDPAVVGMDPQAFARAMNAEGIPGNAGYTEPVYLDYIYLRRQTAFHHSRWPFTSGASLKSHRHGSCPAAEATMKNCFWFPLNEWLTVREIDDVARAVSKIAAAKKQGRK